MNCSKADQHMPQLQDRFNAAYLLAQALRVQIAAAAADEAALARARLAELEQEKIAILREVDTIEQSLLD